MNKILFFLTALSLCLSGCVVEVGGYKIEKDKVVNGVVYNLPKTQLVISADFELMACGENPNIEIIGVSHSKVLVSDTRPESTFTIDPQKLETLLSEIPKADISMSENRLVSINFEAKDQTGEVISKAVDIVALAKGIPLPGIVESFKNSQVDKMYLSSGAEACSVRALNALARKDLIQAQLSLLRAKFNAITQQLTDGYTTSDQFGKTAEVHLSTIRESYKKAIDEYQAGANGAADRASHLASQLNKMEADYIERQDAWLSARNTAIGAVVKDISEKEVELDKIQEFLRAKAEITWAPVNGKPESQMFNIAALSKWYVPSARQGAWASDNKLTLAVMCEKDKGAAPDRTSIGAQSAIYYRIPKDCEISITKAEMPIAKFTVPLAQYGYLGALRLENGAFQSSVYGITFDQNDGRLSGFNFKTEKVVAKEFLTTIETSKGKLQYTEEEKLRDEAAKYEVMKDSLSAQKDYIDMQKQLIEEIEELRKLKESLKNTQ